MDDPSTFDEELPNNEPDLDAALRRLVDGGPFAAANPDPARLAVLETIAARRDDPLERELAECCVEHGEGVETGDASQPVAPRTWCIRRRAELLASIVPRLEAARATRGQDVVPLAALGIELHELWRVYLPLAILLDDLARRHASASSDHAFVLAINAPPGSGKSTLVQLLKFLLVEIGRGPTTGDESGSGRLCIEASQDDFYLTRDERRARGVRSRVEMEGMDVELCRTVLVALADRHRRHPIEIPRFSKALDDREPSGTICREVVDVVLFEGWRVGIDHPIYRPLLEIPDFMLCLDVEPAVARTWKFEQARRDADRAGVPFDDVGLARTWDERVMPVIEEYYGRVRSRADLVITKGVGHAITHMMGRLERWAHTSRATSSD